MDYWDFYFWFAGTLLTIRGILFGKIFSYGLFVGIVTMVLAFCLAWLFLPFCVASKKFDQ